MVIDDWQTFYDSLAIEIDGEPVPKPTSEQLDQFEREAGLKLPRSYRDFIQVFGPGTFQSSFEIAAPGYAHAHSRYDLASVNDNYAPTEEEKVHFRERADLVSRLFYFGLEDEKYFLGWDVSDVRDPDAFECAIYRVRLDTVEFVASSFRELVEHECERLFSLEWDEEELGPQRAFAPATFLPQE